MIDNVNMSCNTKCEIGQLTNALIINIGVGSHMSCNTECEIGQLINALISNIGVGSLAILHDELFSSMNKNDNYHCIVRTLSVENLLKLLLSFQELNNDCFYVHSSMQKIQQCKKYTTREQKDL
jgi:hypothetical protein